MSESRGSALEILENRLKTDYLDMSVLHALSESQTLEKLNEPNVFANVDEAIAAWTLMDPILAANIISMQQRVFINCVGLLMPSGHPM